MTLHICVKQPAVSHHLLECNCSIDFDHFDFLASDANRFRLLIKESLLIKRDQPQLNKTIKSFPLNLFDLDYRCRHAMYAILPCRHAIMKY